MCFSESSDGHQVPPRQRPTPQTGRTRTARAQPGRIQGPQGQHVPQVAVPLRQIRPPMTQGHISPEALSYISRVIDYRLRDLKYAIIGGAACFLLGSSRLTHDLDIIVLNGTKKAAMARLASDTEVFGTAQGGIWVKTDGKRYNLDIMEPQQIGQVFNGNEIVKVQGVNVLHPSVLLQYKQYSYAYRDANRQASKRNDEVDLRFLARYLESTRSGR